MRYFIDSRCEHADCRIRVFRIDADLLYRRYHVIIGNVFLHRDSQIGAAYEQAIHTLYSGNVGDIRQCGDILDLYDDRRPFTTVREMIGHALARKPGRTSRTGVTASAVAEVRGFDDRGRLRSARYMRHNDASCATVEGIANFRRRIVSDPDETGFVCSAKSPDTRIELQPTERSVLGINAKNIQVRVTQDIRYDRRGCFDESSDQGLAASKPFAKAIGVVCHQDRPQSLSVAIAAPSAMLFSLA